MSGLWQRKRQETEGKQTPVFLISIGLIFILPLISFLIGGVRLSFEIPVLKQLATTSFIYEGGVSLPPEGHWLATSVVAMKKKNKNEIFISIFIPRSDQL